MIGTEPRKSEKAAPTPNAYNARWNWVQFTCAFVFAGAIAFLHVHPPLDGLAVHLVKTAVLAGGCAVLAGRFGDSAWRGVVALLRLF